jgi:hypothetical protein
MILSVVSLIGGSYFGGTVALVLGFPFLIHFGAQARARARPLRLDSAKTTEEPEDSPEEIVEETVISTAVEGWVGTFEEVSEGVVRTAALRVASPKKVGWIKQMTTIVSADLKPLESITVVFPAMMLPWPWLSAAWSSPLARQGILTVTDQRLLYHRSCGLRRIVGHPFKGRVRLCVAESLDELTVTEWFEGIGVVEGHGSVLILARHKGARLRFFVTALWRAEGRRAFEVVASSSPQPPPKLAQYWRTAGLT